MYVPYNKATVEKSTCGEEIQSKQLNLFVMCVAKLGGKWMQQR